MYRKSNNTAATLCYAGHLLMEHRSALIVDAELTTADGYAEQAATLEMLGRLPGNRDGARSLATRTTTRKASWPTRGRSGSRPTSPRT